MFEVILVPMWENADQNNSEYGHFSRSTVHADQNKITFFKLFFIVEKNN